METAASHALDQMLFIESERMARGVYDPADCESERTVIISELQGGENDPEQLLDVEVTATAFKAHPYRHPTIGWLGDLQRMTRDDLFEFYRRFYAPNNATLVVVGDGERRRGLPVGRAAIRWYTVRLDSGPRAHRRAAADRGAARDDHARGRNRLLESGIPRAGGR